MRRRRMGANRKNVEGGGDDEEKRKPFKVGGIEVNEAKVTRNDSGASPNW